MPNTERFIPKLEVDGSGAQTNLKPLKVTIQRATRRTEGTELPYVAADDTSPPGDDTKVWLQIWECDSFEAARQKSEGPRSSNEFLVEIPGYIKQTASGGATYEFRVLDAPTLAGGESVGWITLKLKDSHDQPYGGEAGFIVPIVGEAEDDLDLGVTLETSAGTRTHENQQWTYASCLHVANLTHVIGAMLAEGGLTLAFWADINDKNMRDDRATWNAQGRPALTVKGEDGKDHKSAKGAKSGKFIADIINDAEFEVQANAFASKFHSLRLNSAGELILGCTPFWEGEGQIVSAVAAICQKVHQDFLKGRGDPPRLKRIAMMAHGWHSGIWTKRPEHFMGREAAKQFARNLAPNCLDDLVFTLFACLCGYNGSTDATFGSDPASGRRLGEGSFAESLCQSLKEAGLTRAAVWAHTTAGHTTRNPNLRAFVASQGDAPIAADLVWMVQEKPEAKNARSSKILGFIQKAGKKGDDVMLLSILHPGADVQRCTGGSCTA